MQNIKPHLAASLLISALAWANPGAAQIADVSVEAVSAFGDISVEIVDAFGDQSICITNADELDDELREKLGLND